MSINPKWFAIMVFLTVVTAVVLVTSPAHVWIPLVVMGVFVLYSII